MSAPITVNPPTVVMYSILRTDGQGPRLQLTYSDGIVAFCDIEFLPRTMDANNFNSREELMKWVEGTMEAGIDSCHLYAGEYRKKQFLEAKGKTERVQ